MAKFVESEQSTEALLSKADLAMVRDEIINLHEMLKAEAAKTAEKAIFKTEYVDAWYAFRDGPTIVTAHALLAVAPQLSEYFAMCSPGHDFYERARFLKDRAL
jgi:hypothetical protein